MSQTDSQNESGGKNPEASQAEKPSSDQGSSGSNSSSGASKGSKGTTKARKAKKKAAAKVPLTEAQINAPSINTLIMLGVMSVSTLVLWAAGRAACNYHVPGESLTPRAVSLEDRTRQAKDVGIEFGQALSGADFETASKLVMGEGQYLVSQAKAACGACESEKNNRAQLLSTAVVHRANSLDAIVEVKTFLGDKTVATRFLGIEREERKWKVARSFDNLETAELKVPELSGAPLSPVTPGEDEAAEDAEQSAQKVPSDSDSAAEPSPSKPSAVQPSTSPKAAPSAEEVPAPIRLKLPPPQPEEGPSD